MLVDGLIESGGLLESDVPVGELLGGVTGGMLDLVVMCWDVLWHLLMCQVINDVPGGDVPSDVMGGDGKCYNDMQGDVPGTC